MADTNRNNLSNENPTPKDAAELYREGLRIFEGDGVEKDEYRGAQMIAEAAELGDADAQYWIEDYSFDDDAGVQGAS